MVKKEFPQDSNNQEKFTLSRSGTGIGGLDDLLGGGLDRGISTLRGVNTGNNSDFNRNAFCAVLRSGS